MELYKQLWDMEDKLASLGHPWGDEEEHVSSTPDEVDENPRGSVNDKQKDGLADLP